MEKEEMMENVEKMEEESMEGMAAVMVMEAPKEGLGRNGSLLVAEVVIWTTAVVLTKTRIWTKVVEKVDFPEVQVERIQLKVDMAMAAADLEEDLTSVLQLTL